MKMMPLNICLTLLAALALCLAACTGRHTYPRPLLEADSLADLRPDSALALLRAYEDSARHIGRPDSMYLALLKIKATDKLYIPRDTTDGILDIVSYYEHGGDRRLLPMAYYYLARAYHDCGEQAKAIDYFYKAVGLAEQEGDYTVLASSKSQIGVLFKLHGMYEDAVHAFLQAYNYDSIRDCAVDIMYDLRDLGDTYAALGKRDTAMAYLNRALALAKQKGNGRLFSSINLQRAQLFIEAGRYAEAEPYLNVALAFDDSLERSAILSVASHFYWATGRKAEALQCDKQLTCVGSVFGKEGAYNRLFEYYTSVGFADSAAHNFELYKMWSDSVGRLKEHKKVAKRKFAEDLKLALATKRKGFGFVIGALAFLAVMLFSLLIAVFMRRSKSATKQATQGGYNAECDLGGHAQIVNNAGLADSETCEAKLPVAEEKCAQRLASLKSVQKIMLLCEEISAGDEVFPTVEDWKSLDEEVNNVCPVFKATLCEKYKLTEHEYHICLLIKIRIDVKFISSLTCRSKQAISNARTRMYEKCFNRKGTSKEWDEFVRSL